MLVTTEPTPFNLDLDVQLNFAGGSVLIEKSDWDRLKKYTWWVKRSGACKYCVRKVISKNSVFFVRMHRQIMHTPLDMVCHHKTGNSLDNRRRYLENLSPQNHNFFH